MYLPPIHLSPRNISLNKLPINVHHQKSKSSQVNIDISNLPLCKVKNDSSPYQSPKNAKIECASPKSPEIPVKFSQSAHPGPTLPLNELTSLRRKSLLSTQCIESIRKGRRLSIQHSPGNQFEDAGGQDILLTQKQTEECESRHNATQKVTGELETIKFLDNQKFQGYSRDQITKDLERAFEIADQVLTAYGIQARVYTENACDSAMTLLPIIGKRKLANFYKFFIPEMRRFNYLFLSNLRVGAISVCESLRLFDEKYAPVQNKKLYSGLFVLDRLPDQRSIQQHWFRVILYHFLKAVPNFYDEWKDLLLEDPRMKKRASPFEELLVSLNHLLEISQKPWRQDIYMKTRVSFLEEGFRKFDFHPKDLSEENENSPEVLKVLSLIR